MGNIRNSVTNKNENSLNKKLHQTIDTIRAQNEKLIKKVISKDTVKDPTQMH
jgi:hypothetical protein